MKKVQFIIWWGILILLLLNSQNAAAQSDGQLQILSVDASSFPIVQITLLTRDAHSAPLRDVSALALRENGLPITELSFSTIAHGIDVTFVVDANQGFFALDDESELTRQDKIRESIIRYADVYMSEGGLDAVSIVVPDERNQVGEFLLQGETDPAEVVTAVSGYDPTWPGPTPLNDMLDLALNKAQENAGNGRYQAILLFSDSRRLDEQLSFPLLVAKANDTQTPIYVAILGASADEEEVSNAQRLFEPTRAAFYHLADPTATDPLYDIWQQQSNPLQVIYRSRQQQSGRNQVTLNLGSELASGSFEIALADPQVELLFDQDIIRRVGVKHDQPLAELQPQTQELSVTVSWPDAIPRQINELQIVVNDSPQTVVNDVQPDETGMIKVPWDIKNLGSGQIELAVKITDELGHQGISEPISIAVQVDLPQLPAPTVTPTEVPQKTVVETAQEDIQAGISTAQTWIFSVPPWLWPAAATTALVLIILLLLLILKRRRAAAAAGAGQEQLMPEENQERDPGFTFREYAELVSLENEAGKPLRLVGDSMTIGSQAKEVDILLEDASVGRLHARLKHQGKVWWLFDEGSAEGTYLNYERLGLAPRELADGDVLQFGQVRFQYRMRQVIDNDEDE